MPVYETFVPTRTYKTCKDTMCKACPPFTGLNGEPPENKLSSWCGASRASCCSCHVFEIGDVVKIPITPQNPTPSCPSGTGRFSGHPQACDVITYSWWKGDCPLGESITKCCTSEIQQSPFLPPKQGQLCSQALCPNPIIVPVLVNGHNACPKGEQSHVSGGGCDGCDSMCSTACGGKGSGGGSSTTTMKGFDANMAICNCCACPGDAPLSAWGCYMDHGCPDSKWTENSSSGSSSGSGTWGPPDGGCGGGGGGGGGGDDDPPPVDWPPVDWPPKCSNNMCCGEDGWPECCSS